MEAFYRKIYLFKASRVEPIKIAHASQLLIAVEFADYTIPDDAKASAFARGCMSDTIYTQPCTVDGCVVTFIPDPGFFVTGRNILQYKIDNGVINLAIDVYCEISLPDGGESATPEQVLPYVTRAEEAAAQSESAAARAQEVKDSIPDDYTELDSSVKRLKDDLEYLAPTIVCQSSGYDITLDDSCDRPFSGLNLYGKTTQDGTPSPDAPVEIQSVVNPVVTLSNEDGTKNQAASLPYTLHAIPVSSGGNYTDASGQQWVCDDLDFAKGKLIKRVFAIDIAGDLRGGSLMTHGTFHPYDGISRFVYRNTDILAPASKLLSNRFPYAAYAKDGEWITPHGQVGQLNIQIKSDRLPSDDVAGLIAWAQEHPITILAQLAAPVETDLSVDVMAAYAALRTYTPTTNISNDAGAWMELGYQADTKMYIDKKINELATAIVSGT